MPPAKATFMSGIPFPAESEEGFVWMTVGFEAANSDALY